MYKVVYADPPWNFKTYSAKGEGRSAKRHYPTLDIEEICRLGAVTAPDCTLFMWTTWPHLEHALFVGKQWGFTYKGLGFDWMKTNQDGSLYMGMGYVTRQNPEPCLRFTKGNPGLPKARNVMAAILEARREHSRKPDCVYERIETLYDGPYLELFARTKREGWDQFGNEVGRFEIAA
jgi:N6-adenosine-specific RNA methylase IME4